MHLATGLFHALPFSDRRVCSRDEAASYVGVSAGKFNKMVANGSMPKPLRYNGVRRWDKSSLDHAVNMLGGLNPGFDPSPTGGLGPRDAGVNEWDEVIVDGQERPAAKRY